MTEKKKKILELGEEMTCREIASEVGCSFQYAAQVLQEARIGGSFKRIEAEMCVFEGLRNWMNEKKVSVKELSYMVYGAKGREKLTYLYRKLSGEIGLKMSEIDAIIDATGKSYEELFRWER